MPFSVHNNSLHIANIIRNWILLVVPLLFLSLPHSAMAAQTSKSEPQLIIIGGDRDYPPSFFTTKRDSGGTGLGLSVSAGIVKEHGGTMTFERRSECSVLTSKAGVLFFK